MPESYINYVAIAQRAVKAVSEDGRILGAGLHYLKGIDDLNQVLSAIDILSEHCYPRLMPTERFAKSIGRAQRAMKEAGTPRPIWITEYGLYADDDPVPHNDKLPIHDTCRQEQRAFGGNLRRQASCYCTIHGRSKNFLPYRQLAVSIEPGAPLWLSSFFRVRGVFHESFLSP